MTNLLGYVYGKGGVIGAATSEFDSILRDDVEPRGGAGGGFRTEWSGKTFMAVRMKDPILGSPVMRAVAKMIRNCPPPYEVAEGGHFVQEWGEDGARAALEVL